MLFVLTSAARSSGNSTNFIYFLSKPLKAIKQVKLRSVTIPNVIYNVNSTNNVFNWTFGSTYNFVIPPGYYTISSLMSAIQAFMNTQGSPNSYTLTYSSTSGLVTIAGTSNFQINFGVANTCASLLGFPPTTTSSANTFTGSNSPSLTYPLNVFINISEIGTHNRVNNNNFTFFIPMINQNSTILFLNHLDLDEQTITFDKPQNIYQLTVNMVDEFNNNINLLGLDWSLALEID
jgi:hypothetical protein